MTNIECLRIGLLKKVTKKTLIELGYVYITRNKLGLYQAFTCKPHENGEGYFFCEHKSIDNMCMIILSGCEVLKEIKEMDFGTIIKIEDTTRK